MVLSDDKGRIRFEMCNKSQNQDEERLKEIVKKTKQAIFKIFGNDKDASSAYWAENIAQDENDLSKMQYHYKAAASKLKLMEEKRDGAQV